MQKEKKAQRSRTHKESHGTARGAKRMYPPLTEVQKVLLGKGMTKTLFRRR